MKEENAVKSYWDWGALGVCGSIVQCKLPGISECDPSEDS